MKENIGINTNSGFKSWDWSMREQNVQGIADGTSLNPRKNKIKNTS